MKKFILRSLLIVFLAATQNLFAQSVGTLTTWDNENEKVELFQSILIDVGVVKSYDANGKLLKFKNENIKSISSEGHEFRSMRVNSTQPRQLVELIAHSEKYILATYYSGTTRYWLLYDPQGNTVEKTTLYNFATALKKGTLAKLTPYFKDCAELMAKFEENLNIKGNQLFDNISNFECK